MAPSRRGPVTSEIDRTLAERLPLRLLLADDNRVNQRVGTAFLEKMGYRVEVAANGLEVLQALERQCFDLIFLDVHMPQMDGYETARQLRQKWPGDERPFVIAMTGNTMEGDRELCLAAGMDDYISKPIRHKELEAILLRWGSRKRGVDAQQITRPRAA
jgi:CheY-like chemotaxis protein